MIDMKLDQFEQFESLLHRPRIDALLKQGCELPLVTLQAGPGYGKTAAVAHFAKNQNAKFIWLNLTVLDNTTEHFWRNFVSRVEEVVSPEVCEELVRLGFPNTVAKFNVFLSTFSRAFHEKVVFVVDNFGNIKEREIRYFIVHVVEAGIENLSTILISRNESDLDFIGMRTGGFLNIGTNELRFTGEEMRQLFEEQDISLSEPDLEKISTHSEGWPFALFLIALHLKSHPEDTEATFGDNFEMIRKLFYRDFFREYSTDVQKLLIKLSLFQCFSIDIMKEIGGCDLMEATRIIKEHMFVTHEANTNLYFFHSTYRTFLSEQQETISPMEIGRVYQVAGDCFYRRRNWLEAIDCYWMAEEYDKMLSVILSYTSSRMGLGASQAEHILKLLHDLPEEYKQKNPLPTFITALLYLDSLEMDKAEELLYRLEKTLQQIPMESAKSLLGEVYTSLGAVRMVRNREDFVTYFKKACDLLPEGSRYKQKDALVVEDNYVFNIQDNAPGALERMEAAYHEGVPYLIRAFNGGGNGFQYQYSAEAAFLTFQMDKVDQYAYQAIYAAQENRQYDIICNAHLILAQKAVLLGDYENLKEQLFFIQDFINQNEVTSLYDFRDSAISWFYMRMREPDKVVPWIANGRTVTAKYAPLSVGRDRLVHATYLGIMGQFAEVIPFSNQMETLLSYRGLWTEILYFTILRAISYMHMGENEAAVDELWKAYDMSWQNGIVTPFIEMGTNMVALLDMGVQTGKYRFDTQWVAEVTAQSATHAKKVAAMRQEHSGKNHLDAEENIRLTRRELDVLENLAQGLTREEIAEERDISINTVKTNISSIYSKLKVNNRVEAIRIATLKGYII